MEPKRSKWINDSMIWYSDFADILIRNLALRFWIYTGQWLTEKIHTFWYYSLWRLWFRYVEFLQSLNNRWNTSTHFKVINPELSLAQPLSYKIKPMRYISRAAIEYCLLIQHRKRFTLMAFKINSFERSCNDKSIEMKPNTPEIINLTALIRH